MEELRFSEYCANCRKSLAEVEKILFVERELGRCFCCEQCINDYFQPTVEFMDEEYRKLRSDQDFSDVEALRYSHYRSLVLEDPDEVWIDETETGERHYTFVGHFRHGDERVSYVVICLAIDGTPSYVFVSFPTRDQDLVDEYRRGTDARIGEEPSEQLAADVAALPEPVIERSSGNSEHADMEPSTSDDDGISSFERLYLELRQPHDIPRERFERFEPFVDETLDDPDEIWRLIDEEGNEWLTFIARHTEGPEGIDEFTMITICEPSVTETGLVSYEVVFAFPTIDPGLVQHFRRGINSLNKAFGVGWARGRVA